MKNVKDLIKEINNKEIEKQENKLENKTKKEENADKFCEENNKPEEEDAPKNPKKIQEERKGEKIIPSLKRNSYLQEPGPGAGASPRCLETPSWRQRLGRQSPLTSSSSSGTNRSFNVFHTSSETGETSGVEENLILTTNLGSVVCSCSTAAEHSAVVLAGNYFSNCTQGGKTTAEQYLKFEI
jgi:hypothetical protein